MAILPINCQCGHQIGREDIQQVTLFLINEKPLFVHVIYRCPACHRLGSKRIAPDQWQEAVAQMSRQRPSDDLPPIDTDEVIDFCQAIENLSPRDLEALRREVSAE